MSNALTGDFDAVLQVSGATVNRLLATMHQNAGLTTELPTFPHAARLRIGDPTAIDGMRGTVTAQASVPRIELNPRFHQSLLARTLYSGAIRRRYGNDTSSRVHQWDRSGTVRLDPIDPTCFGWSKLAADFMWVRVVGETVSFTGTATDDVSFVSIAHPVDETVVRARITRLITVLLQKQFAATPHKVSSRFRRGSMRSLHVGTNRSVVALPIGLAGESPSGNINSINQGLLEGRDVGVGISAEAIMAKVQEKLDAFRASFVPIIYPFQMRVHSDLGVADIDISWFTLKITWAITLTSLSATWAGGSVPLLGVSVGVITIAFSGPARTEKPQFNWDTRWDGVVAGHV